MSAPLSPSGEGRSRDRTGLWLTGFVLLVLCLRLILAGSLHLTEDEAYYRAWSQVPALGYYDHPPMIAWWIWLGRRAAGNTPLGVRLLPSLAVAAGSFLAFDLARVLGASRRTALRGMVWYNATLLVAAGGFLAIPDAPAAFFWLASLVCLARAHRAGHLIWWLGAGAAAGLATLSKYSALFLAPGVFLWLVSSPEGRRALRGSGPWVALAVAAALFSLNVGWNATHHWATFAKQFARIAPHRFAPGNLVDLAVGQALLLNPLIALFLVRRLIRRPAGGGEGDALLALTCLPFAVYLVIHALHDRVQAHWPSILYPALALIAAFAASGDSARSLWGRLRGAVPLFTGVVVAFALVLLVLPDLGAPLPVDPARPLRDWSGFSSALARLRMREGAAWIGTTSYGLAAQLLAEPDIGAPVLQISERERWRGLRPSGANLARPGLVVDLARRIDLAALRACFRQVDALGDLTRAAPGEKGRVYEAVLVAKPRRDILNHGC
jgi:4-amino-4-deoxy-L-arabinose transferase-like glycosyltransferase